MKRNIFAFFILLAFALAPQLNAQFGVFLGSSIPLGDFADDANTDQDSEDGFAKIGFTIGACYDISLPPEGLHIAIKGALVYNAYDIEKAIPDIPDNWSVKGGKYFNIPVFAGIKYKADISESVALFGEAVVGLSIATLTKIKSEADVGDSFVRVDANTVGSFGFSVGAGVIFIDRISIGLNYLGLGKPDFESDMTSNIGMSGSYEKEQKISALTFTVGFFF